MRGLILKLLLGVVLIASSTFLQAQNNRDFRRFRAAPVLGLNIAQMDGDCWAGFFTPGLQAGAMVYIMLDEQDEEFSLSMEILFSQKGGAAPPSNASLFRQRLNYAEVPVMFNYHDKRRVILSGGLAFARLLSANFRDDFGNTVEGIDDNFEPWDFNYLFRVTFLVQDDLGLGLQYAGSILSVGAPRECAITRGQTHRFISVRTSYTF